MSDKHLPPGNVSAPSAPLERLIAERYSRRSALGALAAAGTVAAMGPAAAQSAPAARRIGFAEIPHGYDATHHVAPGYRAEVLLRWGDQIVPGADAPFSAGPRSAEDQARQFGANCDFIAFMPLPAGNGDGERGLLCVNHEYTQGHLMFPAYGDGADAALRMSAAHAAIELCAVGHSVVEVRKSEGTWRFEPGSPLNRRITALTPIEITGPAAGHPRLRTRDDPTGRLVLGTLANCGGGVTPWGTVLVAEENFHGAFWGDRRPLAGSDPKEYRNHARMGVGFDSPPPGDPPPERPPLPTVSWWRHEPRFNIEVEPREPNRFGYMVEIDPYDAQSHPKKRTALGRFKHENACIHAADGKPAVVYMGDDERYEFIYRFVSKGAYRAGQRRQNADLLAEGTLYVARFLADGSGRWLKIAFDDKWASRAMTGLDDEAELSIDTRLVARLLGATPLDRPEDLELNPATGRVYAALTYNEKRAPADADPANPRAPNATGHILEIVPGAGGNGDHWAESFAWNVLLLAGDPRHPDPGMRGQYGGTVSDSGWFACPDNLAFDPYGRLWVATDGMNDYVAADGARRPIQDGLWALDANGARHAPKHFFACPRGAEATGPAFTPDGRTLFVSVQHPGDEKGATFSKPATRWPDFAPGVPPRASVVAITKDDGGLVGD